jgi:hypothetical protein
MRVAFMGLMRSGKDTSAAYFIEKFGGTIVSFAAPLYEMQKAIYNIAGLPEKKDRMLLQWLGTEWGRAIDQNIWVNVAVNRIKETPEDTNIYVTDCRFENEEKALRELGFTFVMLKAPIQDLVERGASGTQHESEKFAASYTGADFTIANNAGLSELYHELDKVYYFLNPTTQLS